MRLCYLLSFLWCTRNPLHQPSPSPQNAAIHLHPKLLLFCLPCWGNPWKRCVPKSKFLLSLYSLHWPICIDSQAPLFHSYRSKNEFSVLDFITIQNIRTTNTSNFLQFLILKKTLLFFFFLPWQFISFWTWHEVRSCALAHAIGFIQADVQTQEKLHGFTTDRCCSWKELLTARQAQLIPKLLQHEAVSHVKKERFFIIPNKIANETFEWNHLFWENSSIYTYMHIL